MFGEYGSFKRYVSTAMINFVVFYIIWEICYFFLPTGGFWPSVSWALAWILGSYFAHWTHRILTFNSDRNVKWTVPASMSVYTVTLVGSTICYYIGTEFVPTPLEYDVHVRVVWLVNSSLWGIINYFGQKNIAFKPIDNDDLS